MDGVCFHGVDQKGDSHSHRVHRAKLLCAFDSNERGVRVLIFIFFSGVFLFFFFWNFCEFC